MKKYLRWALLATSLIAVYPVATWLALNVYQDNPDAMAWTDREAYNRKFINALQPNVTATQDQIRQKLGGPDITEAYQKGPDLYQLTYYRTQRDISDGITTKTECTALLYLNRRLIAVGESAVQQFGQAQAARP